MSGGLRAALEAALPAGAVLAGEALAARDPGWHPDNLRAGLLVRPLDAAGVAEVLRIAAAHGASVVPQGGRTGLVGGAVSAPGQVILSTERLGRIRGIDPLGRVALVEAGVTLAALQQAAAAQGLEPGIDLAARGSATIGGMIATNAGGMSAFRHGVMRHRLLGLEAVLADGRVLSDLPLVLKAALGPDPRQLLVGAEGTLGIVTAAALRLEPLAPANATALIALPDLAALPAALEAALRPAAGYLAAAEVMCARYLAELQAAHANPLGPVAAAGRAFLLVSLAGPAEAPLAAALEDLAAGLQDAGSAADALIAQSGAQAARLWALREDSEALVRRYPATPGYDVSVPLSALAGYVAGVEAALAGIAPGLVPVVFGHAGDGNLHLFLNLAAPLCPDRAAAAEEAILAPLAGLGGSFSAEHGIGSLRRAQLARYADPARLDMLRALKRLMDPGGLLNPGKLLPEGRA